MRPITEAEVETLKYSCNQGDLELSDREITRRNRRYADAMPLLLADRDRLQRELDAARRERDTYQQAHVAAVNTCTAERERAEKAEAKVADFRTLNARALADSILAHSEQIATLTERAEKAEAKWQDEESATERDYQQQIATLTEERDALQLMVDSVDDLPAKDEDFELWDAKIAQLEADNARLREALESAQSALGPSRADVERTHEILRAALTEPAQDPGAAQEVK